MFYDDWKSHDSYYTGPTLPIHSPTNVSGWMCPRSSHGNNSYCLCRIKWWIHAGQVMPLVAIHEYYSAVDLECCHAWHLSYLVYERMPTSLDWRQIGRPQPCNQFRHVKLIPEVRVLWMNPMLCLLFSIVCEHSTMQCREIISCSNWPIHSFIFTLWRKMWTFRWD